jgi:hypothetical protein
MGELILHQDGDQLELSGFLLKVGDQVEVLHLGSWFAGTLAHDQQGWYVQSLGASRAKIRLRTGLAARLTELT